MPCIGKLFESILNNRLSFKNEVCNDNDPYQAGFKSNSRTTDNIFILCAIVDKQRCLSKPLYTCFVDFTKAFDYIDRTALYYKLLNRGIDGNLLNVIRSMFSKAECRVKWDSRISDILKSEYGVLQGGMLSPKLFTEIFTRHIRNIWPRSRYPCGHLTNGISVICKRPCPFFRICWGIAKTANCSVFICFPLAYHSKHS